MEEEKAAEVGSHTILTRPGRILCIPRKTVPEILEISLRMEQFISDNRWNWCDMNQVYLILKVLHE